MTIVASSSLTLSKVNDGKDGVGLLTTWTFYKLSNSTSAPQVVPIGDSTNLGHLGPNNVWAPFNVLNANTTSGFATIDFDKIAKSDIIPDKPFTWDLEASFDGVSNFNGSTSFNIKFENWYTNSAGSNVYNPLGTRDHTASNFSDTNNTAVTNYFRQSITWTVPRAVYDAIPDGGFLNLRIRIDRFTKLFYHAKNSYVTYGTVPSDPAKRGLGNYSTYGWKTSPEAVSQALPYLWIYQIQFYDNGREVAIPPTLIGTQGLDGRTPYIHWAYSDNADGTGFTTTDNGQRYIGHYSDYTQADSTDKTKYRWADRWAKIEVGGRNLAQKTSSDWSNPYTSFSGIANTCPRLYKVLIDDLVVGDTLKSRIILKYTNIVPASGQTAMIWLQGDGDVTTWNAGSYPSSTHAPISGSGEMVFEHEFKITADHLKNQFWNWQFRTDYIASGSLQWKLVKVEKGTVYTDWSPAPEDIQADIDTKADQALTQEQINALNEINQILEAEMQAKASMEAFSDLEKTYQSFVKANEDGQAKAEADLIEAGRRIELLTTQFGGLAELKTFIDTYMSSSNEGLIIGKNDASSTIKVSSDRISMFSAGEEVMYISQGVININNGIFTASVQIGKFRTEQYHLNADMNVIRYVGG